jgi:hypothetical protein
MLTASACFKKNQSLHLISGRDEPGNLFAGDIHNITFPRQSASTLLLFNSTPVTLNPASASTASGNPRSQPLRQHSPGVAAAASIKPRVMVSFNPLRTGQLGWVLFRWRRI